LFANNSNTALEKIFGESTSPGRRFMETHRSIFLNRCVISRTLALLVPDESKATMSNQFRNLASDLSLQVLFTGVMGDLGIGYKTELILQNPATENFDSGMNIISPIHSEIHCQSIPASTNHTNKQILRAKLRQLLNKVVNRSSCFLNLQGYKKIAGDPIYEEVLAWQSQTWKRPSPVEIVAKKNADKVDVAEAFTAQLEVVREQMQASQRSHEAELSHLAAKLVDLQSAQEQEVIRRTETDGTLVDLITNFNTRVQAVEIRVEAAVTALSEAAKDTAKAKAVKEEEESQERERKKILNALNIQNDD
jgi:hypothetical protein